METLTSTFLFLILLSSCSEEEIDLQPVSYNDFKSFVNGTNYVTDAEKYCWSIVQVDVYNYTTVENATWRTPDRKNKLVSGNLPLTQVSYNDAIAYCKWAKK